MGTMKIFVKREQLDWDYDPAADVLYLSLANHRPPGEWTSARGS